MTGKARVLIGSGLVAALFGGFFYSVLDEGTGAFQYYHTLGELEAARQAGKANLESGLRLNGSVVAGSIQRDVPNLKLSFVMTDGTHRMPVRLNRLDVSDLFKDDALVVVEGRLGKDGVFEAEQLFAKCPTKYEAAEGQREAT